MLCSKVSSAACQPVLLITSTFYFCYKLWKNKIVSKSASNTYLIYCW